MKTIKPLLARIAHKTLGIQTLQPQGSDRLDFHEVSVERLHDELEAAYKAGVEQGRKAGPAPAALR